MTVVTVLLALARALFGAGTGESGSASAPAPGSVQPAGNDAGSLPCDPISPTLMHLAMSVRPQQAHFDVNCMRTTLTTAMAALRGVSRRGTGHDLVTVAIVRFDTTVREHGIPKLAASSASTGDVLIVVLDRAGDRVDAVALRQDEPPRIIAIGTAVGGAVERRVVGGASRR